MEIIDEAPLELAVTFDAEGLTKKLLEEGRVSIYEILFATSASQGYELNLSVAGLERIADLQESMAHSAKSCDMHITAG